MRIILHTLVLSSANIDKLIDFEKKARLSEPEVFISDFDEQSFRASTLAALGSPRFASARCMMCVLEAEVVGRLDFVMLPSLAFGGDLRAYVDWVYVLKGHRHKGIARFLFGEMEACLKAEGASEFFLAAAENEDAQRFYRSIHEATIKKQDVLTKNLKARA